jgi:hypothetical protein
MGGREAFPAGAAQGRRDDDDGCRMQIGCLLIEGRASQSDAVAGVLNRT